ncbi:MAG: DegT/DnrJ/EryC1/StrS family aminotransferase [Acidobacteriota bacterium]|jgi:dTDP-4-amino-4,6-dideoxygalactose transaminase
MKVPLLDLRAQYATIKDKVNTAVAEVMESQRFVMGDQVLSLEKEIAQLCGVPFALGVASGTDALLLSLKALGVGPGDSVVTVPYTFFATAGAIVNLGARPVFIDIEARSFGMDPEKLAAFLNRECTVRPSDNQLVHTGSDTVVKAILPVHLFGQCSDLDPIAEIADRYSLPVVEDACQALGAIYKGRYAGAVGKTGCFSFFPSKNLGGAGDGGMILTSDDQLADRIRLLRTHGENNRYHHSIVGFNSRLDEIQAAVLRIKLPYLEGWSQARRRNAADYGYYFDNESLSEFVDPPVLLPDRSHIFHQYVIRCRRRDELMVFLKNRGVDTQIYYPLSLDEQECFRYLGYRGEHLPCSHAASRETLALPIYPELSDEQKKYVVDSISLFYKQK